MRRSRLKKIADDGSSGGFGGADMGGAMPILLNNPEEKVDNKDEINQVTYGPSLSREWSFEEPLDNAEWMLRDSNKKSRFKK